MTAPVCPHIEARVFSVDPRSGFLQAVDLVDQARARRMAKAPNARIVRRHKDHAIVEVHLSSFGDDSNYLPEYPRGDPRAYSKHHQTDANPENVWYLRHLNEDDLPIYRAAVLENLKREDGNVGRGRR